MRNFLSSTLFALVLVGVTFYFFGDPKWIGLEKMPFSSSGASGKKINSAKGCDIDQKTYDKAAVFEPLDMDAAGNNIPPAVSLLQYAPTRNSQGQQGSCVGWANGYAARTILEAAATGKRPDETIFSPAFVYNQIGNKECHGSYTLDALTLLQYKGAALLKDFAYDESSCTRKPTEDELSQAANYKINGFTRISKSGDNYDLDLDALKQNIAQGGVIVIGMMVPNSFSYLQGQELWEPESSERQNVTAHGGHAMCVIGYDDNKYGGAVQIMNSWGSDWGKDGIVWVKYADFLQFTREGYAMFPSSKSKNVSQDAFQIAVGLQKIEGNRLTDFIPLTASSKGSNTFLNKTPLKKGDRFKIVFENTKDCYVYLYSWDDNGSFLLFPYAKTSPYFGITGVRTFPKEKSFIVDDVGNYDFMSIVVSKKPLDAQALNEAINENSSSNYEAAVVKSLKTELVPNVRWGLMENRILFDGDRAGKNALVMCFQLSKQ